MNDKLQKSLTWAVVLSETSHVFCCIFPTLFSLAGLLAGAGMIIALPPSMIALHEILHEWEVTMIVASGCILALGWAAVYYGEKIDCHSTGCSHGGCAPRRSRAHLVLKIATVLFIFNVIVYLTVHRSGWFDTNPPLAHGHSHEGHESH